MEVHYGKELADRVGCFSQGTSVMTGGSELLDALRPVVAVLQRLGVKHYVGGSVASSMYGVARTTLDVDLIADLEESHVAEFARALSNSFYVSESMIRSAVANRSSFNVIHLATSFKVDVFVPKTRPFDQIAMGRVRRERIGRAGGVYTWIASPEDVVLTKLEWYRLGQETSERQWSDVVLLMKIQQHNLDLSYLAEWARELGITDLLERALGER
jgi:hypothetical protein